MSESARPSAIRRAYLSGNKAKAQKLTAGADVIDKELDIRPLLLEPLRRETVS
jgi:hypothetical protein